MKIAQSEAEVTPEILQALTASGARMYRNNIGVAKLGKFWVAYGVGGKGASDFIGYLPVRVTPEMVGHHIAVFCAAEVKRPKNAQISEKQIIWRDNLLAAGGIAGFCHSWEDGRSLVTKWFERFSRRKK